MPFVELWNHEDDVVPAFGHDWMKCQWSNSSHLLNQLQRITLKDGKGYAGDHPIPPSFTRSVGAHPSPPG